jgi:hypothetical protein
VLCLHVLCFLVKIEEGSYCYCRIQVSFLFIYLFFTSRTKDTFNALLVCVVHVSSTRYRGLIDILNHLEVYVYMCLFV